jgi:hypothetical protein
MIDLKFSCPSCGQHIQCDETHAGENLPCPGCAHLVRVPNKDAAAIEPTPPVVENSPPAPEGSKASYVPIETVKPKDDKTVPTLEENFLAESGTSAPASPPLTEREQQIAAARAAHAAQAAPPVKPRLSFILSGGEAPPPEENKMALAGAEPKKTDAGDSSRESESLSE